MKKLWLLLALVLFNQVGAIGFGVDRYKNRMVMEPKKGDDGGNADDDADDEEEEKEKKKTPPGEEEKKKAKPGAKADDKGNEGDDEDLDDSDFDKLPKSAQALIKKLRKENASKRTEANNLKSKNEKYEKAFKIINGDDENEEPEEKLKKVTGSLEQTQMKAALLEIAYENGVPADQRKYFEFLMSEALESLDEGEELPEEKLEEILGQVRKKGPANTSTKGDGGGKGDKKPGSSDGVTLDQFLAMGMIQRSKLYNEKPEVYNALMAEAKQKKLKL